MPFSKDILSFQHDVGTSVPSANQAKGNAHLQTHIRPVVSLIFALHRATCKAIKTAADLFIRIRDYIKASVTYGNIYTPNCKNVVIEKAKSKKTNRNKLAM